MVRVTGHLCRPTCAVCALDAARARDAIRAELLPRLTTYFDQTEEPAREPAAA